MLDSPRLATVTRRVAPVVEDARPSDAVDDPVQRRDLILLEQARDGSLTAFNSLVEAYQDHLFALVARMVPDRDQASDGRASSTTGATLLVTVARRGESSIGSRGGRRTSRHAGWAWPD